MKQPPALRRGSILKCLFPFSENPGQPGPVPHYCLVLKSFRNGETFREGRSVVAYGTSQLRAHQINVSFSVPTADIVCNDYPGQVTHFSLLRTAVIPHSAEWIYRYSAYIDPTSKSYEAMQRMTVLLDRITVETLERYTSDHSAGPHLLS